MNDQRAGLTWKDTAQGRIPVSARYDDPYFSLDDGLAETAHVFLDGNDLPKRFCDGFRIAELGFGTGLNFLATLAAWNQPGRFHFTSFEAYPMTRAEAEMALAPFRTALPQSTELTARWDAALTGPVQIGSALLHVIVGDARVTLPAWSHQADAWFLDGFSPAKNPAMWEPDLLRAVGSKTAAQGTAATYTAAGHVRRGLEAAGFTVTRTPGFGRKRHMTRAVKAH